MPFNSTAPINAFPSRIMPRPKSSRGQRIPLAEVTNQSNIRSESSKSKQIKTAPETPPSTPGKPVATSPLLGHHHESARIANNLDSGLINKRLSNISNASKFDSPQSVHSTRDIKKAIGPWNLGKTLGEGATGRVRKARHALTGQVAAVKIMSKKEAIHARSFSVVNMDNMIASRAEKARGDTLPFGLEREVVIMKMIDHPHVTKLYDVWENRGEIYLIIEYVEGGELYNYIAKKGRLCEMDAVRIFRQLLSAVNYLHMFRVCHRDIKPENIMVDKQNNVKLVDFGMATREHIGGLDTSCGSPHYAAPEIAMGDPYIGAQADIWACGVVLYVMLTGAAPFGRTLSTSDIPGVLYEIVHTEPDYSNIINPVAIDLLKRMLNKIPSARIAGEDIWQHRLLQHWALHAKAVGDTIHWIGSQPTPLTTDDCGGAMDRSKLEDDILANLCTLWHSVDTEEMIEKLVSDKPNYEKVIYKNLLKFRTEQEENYAGLALEHTDSDVHRLQRRPLRSQSRADLLGSTKRAPSMASLVSSKHLSKSSTKRSLLTTSSSRADLLGAVKRPVTKDSTAMPLISSSSKFTIAPPPTRRSASKQSVAGPSSKSIKSASRHSRLAVHDYDPFRVPNSSPPIAAKGNARQMVHDQPSASSRYGYISYTASLRHPALNKLHSDGSSTRNSVASAARDHLGNRRSLRQNAVNRVASSSSWASTKLSSSSVRQFSVPSMKLKRVSQVSNAKKRSPPPARPQNPTPTKMQVRHQQDRQYQGHSSVTPEPLVVVKKQKAPVQYVPNIRKGFTLSPPKDTDRTSTLWEERTRQASLELSTLMDEVFSETDIEAVLWDTQTEAEKQEEFVRRSFDLPALRRTGYTKPFMDVTIKKTEAPPPCENPPKLRNIYDADSIEELTRVKNLLESRAKDLGTTSLDPVISHLDRLLQANTPSRRSSSAPQAIRTLDRRISLTPVKEEDEARHVSSPLKNKSGRWEKSSFRGLQSTIRLVDEDQKLVPTLPGIKKKVSVPFLNLSKSGHGRELTGEKQSPTHRLKFRSSTIALDKLDTLPDTVITEKTLPSTPPPRESRKRDSDGNKPRNWFRRSHASSISDHRSSESAPSEDAAREGHPRSNTNTSSEEFSFRLPEKESTAARVIRFFTRKPKKNCMQIALPGKYPSRKMASLIETVAEPEEWQDSPTDEHFGEHRRDSRFARPSSPHLFNTANTHEPYIESKGPSSLFARLFNVQIRQTAPTTQLICLQLSRLNAIHELRNIFRDWRPYGLCNVRVSMQAGTVRATVAENNTLRMQPVTFVAAVHAVAVDGNAQGLSIVKVTAEWGNRNSFIKACGSLTGILRGRNLVVTDKRTAREMKNALSEWERL